MIIRAELKRKPSEHGGEPCAVATWILRNTSHSPCRSAEGMTNVQICPSSSFGLGITLPAERYGYGVAGQKNFPETRLP